MCTAGNYQERLTPIRLHTWAIIPLERLKWLVTIAENCKEKKGGALASAIYEFLGNGNPMVKDLAKDLLLAVCNPLYQMLTKWLLEGEICDPNGEFFVECFGHVGPDRLWHEKYRIRNSMVPKFLSEKMCNNILVAGKSINFLCEVCEDKQPVKGRDELRQCVEKYRKSYDEKCFNKNL